eukprot:Skav233324  [mRNA]  locus=scaffold2558:60618:61699:+ [translate_table: standard]
MCIVLLFLRIPFISAAFGGGQAGPAKDSEDVEDLIPGKHLKKNVTKFGSDFARRLCEDSKARRGDGR